MLIVSSQVDDTVIYSATTKSRKVSHPWYCSYTFNLMSYKLLYNVSFTVIPPSLPLLQLV